MTQSFIAVPFKGQKGDGIVEIQGIAKFSVAGIVVEFESKFLGLFGGEVKEMRIGLEDIVAIDFKKGLAKFFSKIVIRLSNMTQLSKLPNSGGKIKLKIKREDFDLAENAVQMIQSAMAEPDESLPPAQSPVAELFEASGDKYKTKELKETRKLD
jgi:hypothetical protein